MEPAEAKKAKKVLAAKYPTIPELYSNDAIVAAASLEELEQVCQAKIQQIQQKRGLRPEWNKPLEDLRKSRSSNPKPTTREGRRQQAQEGSAARAARQLPFAWQRSHLDKNKAGNPLVTHSSLIQLCKSFFDASVLSQLLYWDATVEEGKGKYGISGPEDKRILVKSALDLAQHMSGIVDGEGELVVTEDEIRGAYKRLEQRGLIALCVDKFGGKNVFTVYVNYPYLMGQQVAEIEEKPKKKILKKKVKTQDVVSRDPSETKDEAAALIEYYYTTGQRWWPEREFPKPDAGKLREFLRKNTMSEDEIKTLVRYILSYGYHKDETAGLHWLTNAKLFGMTLENAKIWHNSGEPAVKKGKETQEKVSKDLQERKNDPFVQKFSKKDVEETEEDRQRRASEAAERKKIEEAEAAKEKAARDEFFEEAKEQMEEAGNEVDQLSREELDAFIDKNGIKKSSIDKQRDDLRLCLDYLLAKNTDITRTVEEYNKTCGKNKRTNVFKYISLFKKEAVIGKAKAPA